jgi:hypothetical protein
LLQIKPQRWMYGQRLDDENRPMEEVTHDRHQWPCS